jgi:arginyl-tRNA synthetase
MPLSHARLALARAVGQVLRNGLGVLGIGAPESM